MRTETKRTPIFLHFRLKSAFNVSADGASDVGYFTGGESPFASSSPLCVHRLNAFMHLQRSHAILLRNDCYGKFIRYPVA